MLAYIFYRNDISLRLESKENSEVILLPTQLTSAGHLSSWVYLLCYSSFFIISNTNSPNSCKQQSSVSKKK